jgi:NADPH:quinone reductase-like Zn-dependent oxidoreductase
LRECRNGSSPVRLLILINPIHRGENTNAHMEPAQRSNVPGGNGAITSGPVRGADVRAVVYDKYGPLDVVLGVRDIAKPVVNDDQVLVRVHAASVHIGDCFSVRGAPFAMRLATGLLKPKHGVPGFDLAGQVESVGKNVKQFQAGDAVFGACSETCAECGCSAQDRLALKPANLTFDEAAAVPTSALAALHALRDAAKVQPGQKVLINGASGGVGTFAVQIAKSFGAEVTGVCSTANVNMVRSIGADRVIDYTQEDFTLGGQRYDLIFDNVENRSLSDCRRALTPVGTLLLNSGTGAEGFELMVRLVKPLVLSPFVRQTLRRYLSKPNHRDLVVLKELVESGKLTPVIDKTYPLQETAAALRHIEHGHARGKVVITV